MFKSLNTSVALRNYLRTAPRTLAPFRAASSTPQPPQTVLIEKCLEEPVLVLAEEDDVDIIGPPDTVSNLRPIIRKQFLRETELQLRLRRMQDTTQEWNQLFWANHNTNFIKERQQFVDNNQVKGEEVRNLTADEMSEFYKQFLDNNWKNHLNYNVEWYRKNFTLLFLAFRVCMEKNVAKIGFR